MKAVAGEDSYYINSCIVIVVELFGCDIAIIVVVVTVIIAMTVLIIDVVIVVISNG